MRLLTLFPASDGAQRDPASGGWLITFTDLIGLMLAFFIMLFAMSDVDQNRWENLAALVSGEKAADGKNGHAAPSAPSPAPVATEVPAPPLGRDIGYLAALLPAKLASEPSLAAARVVPGPGRVAIVLPQADLLEGDGRLVSAVGRERLAAIRSIIVNLPNAVRIEAHVAGRAHRPEAWSHAAARAAAVATVLATAGYPHPLEARGYVDPETAAVDGRPAEPIAIAILE
jgi:chemotaxis protein MotB